MLREFVGVDGEGQNLDNGYHAYNLLTCGTESIVPTGTDKRLRSRDCLKFLADQDPSKIYIGFYFDYDVAKILEDLPFSKLDALIHREKRRRNKGGYFPVDWDEYQIEYFPGKEFKVRRAGAPHWVIISDVGPFFQMAFISALKKWDIGTPEEQELIAEGKDLRAKFATVPMEFIIRYNLLECKLIVDLMNAFRKVCVDLDIVPRHWTGPGQIAERLMEKHGVPRTDEIPLFQLDPFADKPDSHRDTGSVTDPMYGVAAFGRYAFYGPWFEISRVGYTSVPAVQWDINSAFPDALRKAPCLIHGEWERNTGKREIGPDELSISFGVFKPKPGEKNTLFSGFSVRRKDGSIYRPMNGRGWYWSFETRAAKHQTFTSYDSWIYHKHCDCQPFAFIEDLYLERKALGKSGKGLVLKLALNSLYGKSLQSIGNPHYSNPIYAGFITALTRTTLMEMIHVLPACVHPDKRVPCGGDVFMVASDALLTVDYADGNETFDLGSGLGQFDKEVRPNGMFIIQPGVYFDPVGDDDDTVFKTRGVPKKKIVEARDRFLAAFTRMTASDNILDGNVRLDYQLIVGIKQALHRKSMSQLGQIVEYKDAETGEPGRKVSFMWHTKRRPDREHRIVENGVVRAIVLTPYPGFEARNGVPAEEGMRVQTVPYRKDIGGLLRNDMMRLAFDNQPDWIAVD